MIEMTSVKVLSLTHEEDVDGIGAQAILFRFFKEYKSNTDSVTLISDLLGTQEFDDIILETARTDYTSYLLYWSAILAQNLDKLDDELKKELDIVKDFDKDIINIYSKIANNAYLDKETLNLISNNADKFVNIDLVILTDLGFNVNFQSLLSVLEKTNIKVAYYDHHEPEENIQKRLNEFCKNYVVDGVETSSEIVKECFMPSDDIANKIAVRGADADFNKYEFVETKRLQSILNRKIADEALEGIMLLLSEGKFNDSLIDKLYKESEIWHNEQIEILKNQTYQYVQENTTHGSVTITIGLSGMRPELATHHLERLYKEKHTQIEKNQIFVGI
ncbi:MAG: hypothetical protein GF364_22040, partial [Candidatus Lokiarchaeota archaeon]|nr:hypothetical protein [Candidatus Lokiarchaeota archaeon]